MKVFIFSLVVLFSVPAFAQYPYNYSFPQRANWAIRSKAAQGLYNLGTHGSSRTYIPPAGLSHSTAGNKPSQAWLHWRYSQPLNSNRKTVTKKIFIYNK